MRPGFSLAIETSSSCSQRPRSPSKHKPREPKRPTSTTLVLVLGVVALLWTEWRWYGLTSRQSVARPAPGRTSASASPPPDRCGPPKFDLVPDSFLAGCLPGNRPTDGCRPLADLQRAKAECAARPECGGITGTNYRYELRVGTNLVRARTGETSHVLRPCLLRLGDSAAVAPRLQGPAPSAEERARSPPRGWTSWNGMRSGVTQARRARPTLGPPRAHPPGPPTLFIPRLWRRVAPSRRVRRREVRSETLTRTLTTRRRRSRR